MFTAVPGFLVKQDEVSFHKPQRFVFRNGLKIEENLEDKGPKISRASYLVGNDTFNYNNVPSLTFTAFYREKLGDEEKSTTRFRKCNISYFLEDDEMKIYEPCNKNSGLLQGCIVGKGKFKNPDGGYYTIDDLNIGNTLIVNGREYTLINCDPFTRNFLTEMGFRVRSPQPDVYDAITMDREEMNTPKSYRKPFVKEYKGANFLKYHPKQLRFYGYYGDGKNLFEERKEVTLCYDLASSKIKLVEERGRKEEKVTTSVILRPTLVPKGIGFPRTASNVEPRVDIQSIRLLMRGWGILSHSPRRALSSSWRVCGGVRRSAIHLPRILQTCSLGFMSGEHAVLSIRMVPSFKRKSFTKLARCGLQLSSIKHDVISNCCSVRDYNGSQDLIPISSTGQNSISNDMEIGSPINRDASVDHDFPTAKFYTFEHECRIVSGAAFLPDKNTSIIKINRKTGPVKEKNIAPFISPPVHMLCCPLPAGETVPCC
nr:EF-hand domain-containing family member C2-like [Parasteatoda tepidariorum]